MIDSGTALGPYVVLGRLGSGGMGDVYRAHDGRLDRDVALKLLPREFARDPGRLLRFRQEALHLAALNHPNIATIHGFEDAGEGMSFLVLELVEGRSLADRIEEGPLPPEEALAIAAQIAEALEAAHERGVIHRDLKPANVMLGPRGRVKVLDFGLARGRKAGGAARALERAGGQIDLDALMQSPDGATLAPIAPPTLADPGATLAGGGGATMAGDAGGGTGTGGSEGGIEGTPGYMSPEQIAAGAQDARTDVFAFGAVLYEALAGVPAFPGETMGEMLRATLEKAPAWDRLPERLSPRIRAMLEQALEKNMAKRPDSVHDLRIEIEDVLGIRRAAALRAGEATAVAHNLPRLLTSFVGREGELAACGRLLAATRMLTLTGFGGSGKTRLALELATRALEDHPDGVWFVDLAPVRDASRIEAALGTALSVREEPGRSLTEALLDRLRGRRALVLLDNCEHLLAPCAALASVLLRACPELRMLATSREALSVEGETVHAVPTLSCPAEGERGLAALAASESVRLYVERARLVAPDFALSEATAPVVGEICRRLDGIPLALELAAARARVLAVEQILDKLGDRFRLLTGGSRTALPRQQTLRATIQWSYDMLAEREQEFFRRLAVFAGGWSLEGAVAVVEADADEFEVLDLLTLLADKSLAVVDRGSADAVRYRFLESVRQFALDRLRETDEEPALRERHLAHFLKLAEAAESQLLGPQQGQWFARLDADGENLLAALTASRDLPQGPSRGLRLAGAVARFWSARGRYVIGLRALVNALEVEAKARAAVGDTTPDPARGKALVRAGGLALYLGDLDAAGPPIEESLAIYEALQDKKGVARSYSALATLAAYRGDFAESRGLGLRSLELYRENGDKRGIAVTLHNLGYLALLQADWLQASPAYEEALALLREVGDREHLALTLADLAIASQGLGRAERAHAELAEALALVAELSAPREGAYALEAAALLAEAWGELPRAARFSGAAQALRETIGSPLVPLEKGDRDALRQRLERALGGPAYAEAHEGGRGLGFVAAIAEARYWLDHGGP
jgi:predicted ATPase/serine/threonine protein kinase